MSKLLTKKDMLDAGKLHNWYTIMNDYLDVMPFSSKERSEVKLALTIKIEYAFEKGDKKSIKTLDKRMKELRKETKRRKKIDTKSEEFNEEHFIEQMNAKIKLGPQHLP